jgi:hypothetical protein
MLAGSEAEMKKALQKKGRLRLRPAKLAANGFCPVRFKWGLPWIWSYRRKYIFTRFGCPIPTGKGRLSPPITELKQRSYPVLVS